MALDEAGYGECKVLKSGEWQSDKSIPIAQDLIASGEPFDVILAPTAKPFVASSRCSMSRMSRIRAVVSINGKEDEWHGSRMAKRPLPFPTRHR